MLAIIPLDVIIFRPEPYPHQALGVAVKTLYWFCGGMADHTNPPFDSYTANIGESQHRWSVVELNTPGIATLWRKMNQSVFAKMLQGSWYAANVFVGSSKSL